MMGFTCFCCKLIFAGKPAKLFSHLHVAHALYDGPGLVLQCDQGGCPFCFSSFNSLRKHLYKVHAVQVDENDDDLHQIEENEERTELTLSNNEDEEQQEGTKCAGLFSEEINKQANMFVLGLLSRPSATHTSIQNTLQGTSELMEAMIGHLQTRTENVFKEFNIDISDPKVQELFNDFSSALNPFTACQSRYKQDKYFVENLGLVKPRTVVLGTRYDTATNQSSGQSKQVIVRDSFQYIPIKDTLGSILSDTKYLHELNSGHQSRDGIMRDYCDGSQFKLHPLFSTTKGSLQLCLYFDEYEVVNPLGSKRGVHKVGSIYYTLQNLPPIYNSALCNIHMLSIFTCIDLQKYGFGAILAPFLEELSELESAEGMVILLQDGTTLRKRGTVTQILADNLGANSIGGFVESFGANYPCRTCLTARVNFQACIDDDKCILRNKTNYEKHIDTLAEDPDSVSQHGIKRSCAFNQSQFFHITTNCAPDIMHDILEGVAKRECKLILRHFISYERFFSLDLLNTRIKNFSYGFADQKNKPSIVTNETLRSMDSNFKNSASQMWCFVRVLPLLIGDKVPQDHRHWELFLRLRRIMDIIFSRATTQALSRYLKSLIEDHHTLYIDLFPEANVTAKHHFMVHYPYMMIQVGPLINCWCMRYEAKHAFGKNIADVVCNFKDICFTIAQRHQIQQCQQQLLSRNKLEYVVKGTNVSITNVSETDGKEQLLQRIGGLTKEDNIHMCQRVSIHGTEYRVGMMLVIGCQMELPVFGQLNEIYIVADVPHLFGIEWTTEHFDDHYHAYLVSQPSNASNFLIKYSELKDHHPLHVCCSYDTDSNGEQYIITRSSIIG